MAFFLIDLLEESQIRNCHISFQIVSSDAEIEYAGGPGGSAEGAGCDLREGQQGDEEQPGQGGDDDDDVLVIRMLQSSREHNLGY